MWGYIGQSKWIRDERYSPQEVDRIWCILGSYHDIGQFHVLLILSTEGGVYVIESDIRGYGLKRNY